MKKAHLTYLESVKTGKRKPATVLEIDQPRPAPSVSSVGTSSNRHHNKLAGLGQPHSEKDSMNAEEKSIVELITSVDRCEDATTDSLLAAEAALVTAQAAHTAVAAAHKWVCGGKSGGPVELQSAVELSVKAVQAAETARTKAQAAADAASVASVVLAQCANEDAGAAGTAAESSAVTNNNKGSKLIPGEDAQVGCVPSLAPRAPKTTTRSNNTSPAAVVMEDTNREVAPPVSTPGATSGKGKARKGAKTPVSKSGGKNGEAESVSAQQAQTSSTEEEKVMALKPQEVWFVCFISSFFPCVEWSCRLYIFILYNLWCCFFVFYSRTYLLPIAQGYPGMHIVRTLVERLDDIPEELATDPGELPADNMYRIGLVAEVK